jgi:hypothetical protein
MDLFPRVLASQAGLQISDRNTVNTKICTANDIFVSYSYKPETILS